LFFIFILFIRKNYNSFFNFYFGRTYKGNLLLLKKSLVITKNVSILYLDVLIILGGLFGLIGFSISLLIRIGPYPVLPALGYDLYYTMVALHALFMIFFMVLPILAGKIYIHFFPFLYFLVFKLPGKKIKNLFINLLRNIIPFPGSKPRPISNILPELAILGVTLFFLGILSLYDFIIFFFYEKDLTSLEIRTIVDLVPAPDPVLPVLVREISSLNNDLNIKEIVIITIGAIIGLVLFISINLWLRGYFHGENKSLSRDNISTSPSTPEVLKSNPSKLDLDVSINLRDVGDSTPEGMSPTLWEAVKKLKTEGYNFPADRGIKDAEIISSDVRGIPLTPVSSRKADPRSSSIFFNESSLVRKTPIKTKGISFEDVIAAVTDRGID